MAKFHKADPSLAEAARAEANKRNKGGDFGPYVQRFTFKGNKAFIRLLPPWTDKPEHAGKFWRILHQHWGVASFPVTCPKHTPGMGGQCDICDIVDELRTHRDTPDDMELAKKLKASATYMFQVLDLSDRFYTQADADAYKKKRGNDATLPFAVGDVKLQVYNAPLMVYNQILDIWKEGGLDITDMSTGFNLTVTREGEGKTGTKYTVVPQLGPTAFGALRPNDPSGAIPLTKKVNGVEVDTVEPVMLDEVYPPSSPEKVTDLLRAANLGDVLESKHYLPAQGSKAAADDVDENEALASVLNSSKEDDGEDVDDLEAELRKMMA